MLPLSRVDPTRSQPRPPLSTIDQLSLESPSNNSQKRARSASPTSSSGGQDTQDVAGLYLEGDLAGEELGGLPSFDQPILSWCAQPASAKAPGSVAPPFAHQRHGCRLEELDLTINPFTSRIQTGTAAPPAQRISENLERVVGL